VIKLYLRCYSAQHLICLPKQQEHELRELESLIEAKIYREDELERQIELLKREAARPGTALSHTSSTNHNDGNASHSRAPSAASNHTSGSADGCPLCHGDHELDVCPVFNNQEPDESPDKRSPSLSRGELLARRKSGLSMEQVWCDNCDVSGKFCCREECSDMNAFCRPRTIGRRIVRWRMMSFRRGISWHTRAIPLNGKNIEYTQSTSLIACARSAEGILIPIDDMYNSPRYGISHRLVYK
jgi:hypothetical protein